MAEPISMNEAVRAIKEHADEKLPPATAKLLRRLGTMWIAGVMPSSLVVFVLDVGRELRVGGESGVQ